MEGTLKFLLKDKYISFKKLSSLNNLTNLASIGGNFEIYAPEYEIAQLNTIELPTLKQINGYIYMRNGFYMGNRNRMNLVLENLENWEVLNVNPIQSSMPPS